MVITQSTSALSHTNSSASASDKPGAGDSPYIDSRSSPSKVEVDAIAAGSFIMASETKPQNDSGDIKASTAPAEIKLVANKYAKFLQCCDASTSPNAACAVRQAQVLLDELFDRNAEIIVTRGDGDGDDCEFIKYTTGANATLATSGYRYRMRPSPCLFMLRRTKNVHVEVVGVDTMRVSYDAVAEGWDDAHVERIVTVRNGKVVHSRPVDNNEDSFPADRE
mmetsp:Transcript_24660/g.50624  ORF Transcript_24660/g.50624 Transcript_24660/m.50624 type:complete len:222 (+) Transcript_24660:576-1241(+)|eukprot:CAMPEP_0178714310 /NCGR_PEP_ID=MMETSP0699-20121125/19980_1 /TAXON_ID=265572 /ORGANISM="Extubocellulus spinifer, Strain CCMP396" /LENGTH=221 /DNA_ID=CAMNT_0020363385 /DNA_START=1176 /DNA_END=1841 /DNA_ORIENTATION=-